MTALLLVTLAVLALLGWTVAALAVFALRRDRADRQAAALVDSARMAGMGVADRRGGPR